jgi:phage baseplate assembly protein W
MSFDLKIINNDLAISSSGDLQKVVDTDKLVQDILKICLTTAGSNPLQPWYGSFLSRSVIGSALSTDILVSIAKSQLNSALNDLRNLQNLQVQSMQKVSADEQIAAILGINVLRNQIDPRLFSVSIKVLTKGTKAPTTNFTVSTI